MVAQGQTVGEGVEALSRDELIAEWTDHLGFKLPKSTSTGLLRRAVAFERQAAKLGDLAVSDRAALVGNVQKSPPSSKPVHQQTKSIKPGSVLIREWNGRSYQVHCKDKGFELDGKTYPSLSAIAKKITGAHWSGPRFFGLIKLAKAK